MNAKKPLLLQINMEYSSNQNINKVTQQKAM